jgi:hypothetical protein
MENTKRRKLQKQDRRFEQDKPELLLRTSCYCHHYYFRSGAGYLLVLILVTLLVTVTFSPKGLEPFFTRVAGHLSGTGLESHKKTSNT